MRLFEVCVDAVASATFALPLHIATASFDLCYPKNIYLNAQAARRQVTAVMDMPLQRGFEELHWIAPTTGVQVQHWSTISCQSGRLHVVCVASLLCNIRSYLLPVKTGIETLNNRI